MKKLAKVLSLALVLVMVLSLGGAAWADPEPYSGPYTITITNPADGATYTTYKIFDVTYADDDNSGTPDSGSNYSYTILTRNPWFGLITSDELASREEYDLSDSYGFKLVKIPEKNEYDVVVTDRNANGDPEMTAAHAKAFAEHLHSLAYPDSDYPETLNPALEDTKAAQGTFHASATNTSLDLVVTDSGAGYYFTTTTMGSLCALTTAKPTAEILEKNSTPTPVKKVLENNDYTSSNEDKKAYGDKYNDVADYNINDDVPFELIGTTPSAATLKHFIEYVNPTSGQSDPQAYQYIFSDIMSPGLNLNDSSIKVFLVPKTATHDFDEDDPGEYASKNIIRVADTYYQVVSLNGEAFEAFAAANRINITNLVSDESSFFQISFSNLIALSENTFPSASNPATEISNYDIVVRYTATLNEDARIGLDGNPNTEILTYSNSDFALESSLPDTVVVFTFETQFFKVDSEHYKEQFIAAVKAQDSTLDTETGTIETQYTAACNAYAGLNKTKQQAVIDTIKTNALGGAEFVLYRVPDPNDTNAKEYLQLNGDKVKSWGTVANATKLNGKDKYRIAGLDAGTYYLEETKAPAGYNILRKPVEIEVAPTYDADNRQNYTAANSMLTNLSITFDSNEGMMLPVSDAENRGDKGGKWFMIGNNQGPELPTTGGVGTTLFYVFGSMLVIAAAVYFVTKKRSEVE